MGLLATVPASSESANSHARLSSSITASRSSVLGSTISWSSSEVTTSDGPTGELGGEGEGSCGAGTSPEDRGGVQDRFLFLGEGDLEGAADVQMSIVDRFWARGISGEEERIGLSEGLWDDGREVFHTPLSISISSESSAPLRENWLRVNSVRPAALQAFA